MDSSRLSMSTGERAEIPGTERLATWTLHNPGNERDHNALSGREDR